MSSDRFTPYHRLLGSLSAWGVFALGMIYLGTLVLGLLSLKSPQDPIGDPYFSLLEVLIVLMAPLLVVSLVAAHAYAAPDVKAFSFTALVFMVVAAGLTSSVHFVILSVSRPLAAAGLSGLPLLLSFTWPSVAYAVDILAWDWFFALAVLCAAPVFKAGRLGAAVRWLFVVSGVLSLAGLIGVPLADMQIRLIGVLGYAGVAPVGFLLLGFVFSRARE